MSPDLRVALPVPAPSDDGDHILVVISCVSARMRIARQLRACDYRVTAVSSFGMAEVLRANRGRLDLFVTVQSASQMTQFGLPQLARALEPNLPILVLDREAASGHGVAEAVQNTIRRWPLRERAERRTH